MSPIPYIYYKTKEKKGQNKNGNICRKKTTAGKEEMW